MGSAWLQVWAVRGGAPSLLLVDWLREHETLVWWLGVLSAVTFVGSLALVPFMVARIPADYFAHKKAPPPLWSVRHPSLRRTIRILMNVLGAVLVLLGFAMLVLPGQGILTILVGVTIATFPGKRELELRIVRRRRILRALNWIRQRTGAEPLRVMGALGRDGKEPPSETETPS